MGLFSSSKTKVNSSVNVSTQVNPNIAVAVDTSDLAKIQGNFNEKVLSLLNATNSTNGDIGAGLGTVAESILLASVTKTQSIERWLKYGAYAALLGGGIYYYLKA